jgi:hypothetical protein
MTSPSLMNEQSFLAFADGACSHVVGTGWLRILAVSGCLEQNQNQF